MNPPKEHRCFFVLEAYDNPLLSKEAKDRLRFRLTDAERERLHNLWLANQTLDNKNITENKKP